MMPAMKNTAPGVEEQKNVIIHFVKVGLEPDSYSPCDVLLVSDRLNAPMTTSPVPTKSRANAASTVRQFSLTFG